MGRNAPCPCGSQRKYKRCCGGRTDAPRTRLAHYLDALERQYGLDSPPWRVFNALLDDARRRGAAGLRFEGLEGSHPDLAERLGLRPEEVSQALSALSRPLDDSTAPPPLAIDFGGAP